MLITIDVSAQPVMTQNLANPYESSGMKIFAGSSISGNPIQFTAATILLSGPSTFTFNNTVNLNGANPIVV